MSALLAPGDDTLGDPHVLVGPGMHPGRTSLLLAALLGSARAPDVRERARGLGG